VINEDTGWNEPSEFQMWDRPEGVVQKMNVWSLVFLIN